MIALFAIVFVFFLLTRFVNLDKHLVFGWDQETYSTAVRDIVQNHKFTLIGPRANNDRGFFLGPHFTYLITPFYMATNLHPIAMLYFVMVYNLIFFGAAIFIISKVFGKLHALFFSAFWTFNYLLVQYDSTPWWSLLLPLGVLLVWGCLYMIHKKPKMKWYVALGLTLGFFMNQQAQFIFVIAFAGLFLLQSKKRSEILAPKKLLALIASFVVMFLPLILFDLRHDFLNTRSLLAFFAPGGGLGAGRDPNIWMVVVGNLLKPLIYWDNTVYMRAILVLFFILAVVLGQKREGFYRQFYRSFAVVMAVALLAFLFVGKRPTETYYIFLYPFFYMVLIDIFLTFKQVRVLTVLFFIIMATNIKPIQKWMAQFDPLGLYSKDLAVKVLKDNLDHTKGFNISYDIPFEHNSGYPYLVNWYKIPTSGKWTRDPLAQMRLPAHPEDIRVGVIGLFVPDEVRVRK